MLNKSSCNGLHGDERVVLSVELERLGSFGAGQVVVKRCEFCAMRRDEDGLAEETGGILLRHGLFRGFHAALDALGSGVLRVRKIEKIPKIRKSVTEENKPPIRRTHGQDHAQTITKTSYTLRSSFSERPCPVQALI